MDNSRSLPPTVNKPAAVNEGSFFGRGQILASRYEIKRFLGRGGMGEVWHAFDLRLRVDVALKLLQHDTVAEVLRREVRAAREVMSPNVCRIFDLVDAESLELLSMEYVDGVTLRAMLDERGSLELREAQQIAAQFLAGLEAIHAAGLVHRDFKPSNVMITHTGRVLVMDFGLAKPASSDPGSIAGTPAYMAPEQMRGEKVDARADIFAAGVVLDEMLGRAENMPWSGVVARARVHDPAQRFDSASALSRALEEISLRLGHVEERSPYPGLASFTEADADSFFGREAEVEAMWRKLSEPARLLGLIGPSGAGKSSLLRAGLIPAKPGEWHVLITTPGIRPFSSLARALAPHFAGDVEAIADLTQLDDPAIAIRLVSVWRRRGERALLIFDQFEELFTLNSIETQRSFSELLARLPIDTDVHVLLSMRDDFLMRCHDHAGLAPLFSELTPLKTPAGEALRRALVQPALNHGYRFEDETLVEEVVEQVGDQHGALPLAAFAMARLWDKRDRNNGLLTRAAYEEIGGIAGALAQHAEATLERIGAERGAMVRELFRNLVTAQGTRAARDREELLSLFPNRQEGNRVLDALIDARLLTSHEAVIEIIHESLLTKWPRLVHWQTQDAEGAQFRDELRQAAHLWMEHGRPDDYLWAGTAFRAYQLWRERYSGALTELEEAFANAFTAYAQRRRRRRLTALASLVVLTVLTAGATTFLWRRAESEARRATAANLLALGQLELDSYPTAALAYATRSLEVADTAEARRFAVKALWRGPTAFILPFPSGQFLPLAFSPDGKWLATGAAGGNVLLYPSSGGRPIELQHEGVRTRHSEFSPRSDLLITKAPHNDALRVWSVPEGKLLRRIDLEGDTFFVRRAGWIWTLSRTARSALQMRRWSLPDGPHVDIGSFEASAFDIDPTATLLALGRGREILIRPLDSFQEGKEQAVATLPQNVVQVAFGQNRTLLARDASGEIRVWSLEDEKPRLLRVIDGAPSERSAVFDPTSRRVAITDETEGMIRVWEIAGAPEAEPLQLRRGDVQRIQQLDFATRAGEWLAATNATSGSFWPLTKEYPRVFRGHTAAVRWVRFAPDGSWIASTSFDGTLRIWPLDGRGGSTSRVLLNEPGEWMLGLAVDPSGKTILVGDNVGKVFLASPDGQPPVPLEAGLPFLPQGAAFDRGGRRAALGAGWSRLTKDRIIRIWDVETRAVIRDLELLQGRRDNVSPNDAGVATLEFAPDGSLYSAGKGGVRRWDVERGTSETVVAANESWVAMDLTDDGRRLLTATMASNWTPPSVVRFHDLGARTSRTLASHGSNVVHVALDPTGTIAVTASADGTIRAGRVTGEEPHLLYGHRGDARVAVSSDGRWIASGGGDGTVRVWPMPDVSKPPLHTLPHDELLAKLKSLTNLRVVEDKSTPTGYKVNVDRFPGWENAPTW